MSVSHQKKVRAVFLALVSCVIWAGHNVLARGINDTVNPVELTFWRWVFALMILLPFTIKNFKKNFALFKNNLSLFIWIAMLVHVIYNTFFYAAAHFTTANNLSLLTTTSFVWTIIFGILLGIDKASPKKIIGAALALSGVLVVVTKQNIGVLLHFTFNTGDIILITACFAWGLYAILVKRKPADMDQIFMFAAVVSLGLIMIFPLYIVEHHIAHYPIMTWHKLYIFLMVGCFASVLSWGFYNNSIHVLGPVNTSIIFFLLPVFSAVMAYIWLGEKLYFYHVIGFILIISGIAISNIRLSRKVALEPIN